LTAGRRVVRYVDTTNEVTGDRAAEIVTPAPRD
jgi:hypothetical protein